MAPLVAIVAGVGPGTGASVAKKFAKKYPTILLARSPQSYTPLLHEITSAGGTAIGIPTDLSSPSSLAAAFHQIQALGPRLNYPPNTPVKAAAAIFNAGGPFVRKPFLDLSEQEFESGWAISGRAAFLFAQAVLPLLLPSAAATNTGAVETENADAKTENENENEEKEKNPSSPSFPPALIFTGATASLRGSAQFAAVAPGKFALRALAQSLGREFGPRGVHVAHVVIDGVIDSEKTKAWVLEGGPEAKIQPDAIAEQYWFLHTQPRTAFTHELDLRPAVEKW